jgi:cytochrome b involved in lipid metabolism
MKKLILLLAIVLIGCTSQTNVDVEPSVDITMPKAQPAASTESISFDEVMQHNTGDSCYVVVNDKVYDVTDHIENAREYRDVDVTPDKYRGKILTMCGGDATELFTGLYGDNHMRIDTYYIGELA